MPVAESTALDRCLLTGCPGAPVICVLGGISANRDVRGWWPAVVGEGRHLDTREFRVLGVDFLDGGEGTDGRPERVVTTHDQADLIAAVLDELRIDRLHALVGASYGGMVGLALVERHAARVERLVAVSAPAEPHPMSTALRSLQRRTVELGLDSGRGREAMSIARGLAMTTFRSAAEFAGRFGVAVRPDGQFESERYLRHHGEKFARSFPPARFLALSLSADLHRIDPAACTTPALFVAARGDSIVPREQLDDLARRWGGPSRFHETVTRTGHDAFLAEPQAVGALIHDFINSPALS